MVGYTTSQKGPCCPPGDMALRSNNIHIVLRNIDSSLSFTTSRMEISLTSSEIALPWNSTYPTFLCSDFVHGMPFVRDKMKPCFFVPVLSRLLGFCKPRNTPFVHCSFLRRSLGVRCKNRSFRFTRFPLFAS